MRNLDRRARAAVATVTLSLVMTACGGTTVTQAPSAAPATNPGGTAAATAAARTIEDVCADAAGTTLNYFSPSDVPEQVGINAEFNKAYPEIEVIHHQVFPGEQVTRVLTEAQAGREHEVGIVQSNMASQLPIFEAGLVADLPLKELGFPENIVAEIGGVEVVRSYRQFGGLMYNTEMTNPADLPDTWEELAAATELKGRFMAGPRGVYLGALRLAWSKEEYETFITNLVANLDPVLVDNTSSQAPKILTGEFVTGDAGVHSEVAQQAATGAPIAMKYLDVITTFDGYATILDRYPNKDAAICYVNWTIGPEGLEALFDASLKENFDLPQDGTPEGAVVVEANSEEELALYSEGSVFFAEALEGQPSAP